MGVAGVLMGLIIFLILGVAVLALLLKCLLQRRSSHAGVNSTSATTYIQESAPGKGLRNDVTTTGILPCNTGKFLINS